MTEHPALMAVVLDAVDARGLAEFYRQLLGYRYRPGDEPPPGGKPDRQGEDWLVLADREGRPRLAVQPVAELTPADWPAGPTPQQLHLDLAVPDVESLTHWRDAAVGLGATVLDDRTTDPIESLIVFADPAGHPFCILVSPMVRWTPEGDYQE
ncbi:MAG: VOC family protein [Actinomycetota bacterium]